MSNNNSSYTDFKCDKNVSIGVPYPVGTLVELNGNTNVWAKICQYRIVLENYKQVIYVGLSYEEKYNKDNVLNNSFDITNQLGLEQIYDFIDFEITIEELLEKWKKIANNEYEKSLIQVPIKTLRKKQMK